MYGFLAQGTLFPMCGMNLAFNRELIGPAMYFGLMGDGQPLGRYDDMWAGWCSKVGFAHRSADRNLNAVSRLTLRTSAPDVLLCCAAEACHHQGSCLSKILCAQQLCHNDALLTTSCGGLGVCMHPALASCRRAFAITSARSLLRQCRLSATTWGWA